MGKGSAELSPMERAALAITRFANERPLPKRAQQLFLRTVSRPWVAQTIAKRTFVEREDIVLDLAPDRGVLLLSNHRTFFDMYVTMLVLFMRECAWVERVFFPVRSNFFYENPVGLFLNMAIGGGTMYPPIFRDRAKSAHNDDALDRLKRFLADPGVIVGMHPEGTRGKGPDPYQLLPAQPGVGRVALSARPIVVPMWILGMTNNILAETRKTHRRDSWRSDPTILVFGEPVDYDDLAAQKPRFALHKRAADRFRAAIIACGERERALRADIVSGAIDRGDRRWLMRANGAA
jgi:1-acyl-sn-glycerol-3-phosphate acyltransferase